MCNTLKSLALLAAVSLLSPDARSQEPVVDPHDFDQVISSLFWQRLYPAGGYTLLCGKHFNAARLTPEGESVVVDAVFPLSEIMRQLRCPNRAACRAQPGGKFRRMESDMHNMYPETRLLATQRLGRSFGVVEGEEGRVPECDVEWRNGLFEPRELAQGNVARAILYMRATYGLTIDDATLELMKAWHRADPPSKQERERNDAILDLQGRRNPFVDRPELVENLHNLRR